VFQVGSGGGFHFLGHRKVKGFRAGQDPIIELFLLPYELPHRNDVQVGPWVFLHLLEHMEVDVCGIKTDSFGPIIFTLFQKLMDACDPHQGGNIGAFDRIDGGSDACKVATDSKKKGDEQERDDLFHAAIPKA
jgi:hypothetical protein